jgi:dihydroorotase
LFAVFANSGTLWEGAAADVAILDLRPGSFDFADNYENTTTHGERLFPSGTICRGTLAAFP